MSMRTAPILAMSRPYPANPRRHGNPRVRTRHLVAIPTEEWTSVVVDITDAHGPESPPWRRSRLVVCESTGLLGSLPFDQGGCDARLLKGALEFDLADDAVLGVDLEGEPGVFLAPVAAEPPRHGVIVPVGVEAVRSQVLRPYPDGVFVGAQVKPGLAGQEVFPTGLPGVGAVAVGPDHLEEWERRLAVVADRGAEERLVPLALTESLHARGALQSGLTPEAAADLLYALLSPHVHQLLRRHRNWSSERYRTWLELSLTHQLLDQPHP